MHLFYTPDINTSIYTLQEEESKHCIKVLRLQEGDFIYLVDGRGGYYTTRIAEPHPKRCVVEVMDVQLNYGQRPYYLHMAISPLKFQDRFEWYLEKATELGIDEITPIICNRSEKKVLNLERCNKIIVSAMKQSGKAYHPKINAIKSYKQFIAEQGEIRIAIAHCEEAQKVSLNSLIDRTKNSYLVLIGPEGDFDSDEIKMALDKNAVPITLGNDRYRTETAAVMTCVVFQQAYM